MSDRRSFLRNAALGGLAIVGGGVGMRRAYAVNQFRYELIERAAPALTEKESRELTELPRLAGREISGFGLGLCMRCHNFAVVVCGDDFQRRVTNASEVARERLYRQAFAEHVAPAAKVEERFRTIAVSVGDRLDTNWIACCDRVAADWGALMRPHRTGFAARELVESAESILRTHVREAIDDTESRAGVPTVAGVAESIGRMSVNLAFRDLWDYFEGFFRSRQSNVQRAVSRRLAEMCREMEDHLETDVRTRIAELHRWQHDSIESVAADQASRTIGWL